MYDTARARRLGRCLHGAQQRLADEPSEHRHDQRQPGRESGTGADHALGIVQAPSAHVLTDEDGGGH